MRFTALIASVLALPADSILLQNAGDASTRAWSKTGMRPEVAARMLGEVELKWVHSKLSVLMGDLAEDVVEADSMPSCSKIVQAIMQGSGGDANKVDEYMQDVCEESAATGYDKNLCTSFAEGCTGIMTADFEFNRDSLDSKNFCKKFLSGPVTDAARKWQEVADDEAEKRKNATSTAVAVETTEAVSTLAATEATTEAAATVDTTVAVMNNVATESVTSTSAPAQEVAKTDANATDAADDVSEDDDDTPANSTSQATGTDLQSTNTSDITATLAKLKQSQALKAKVHRHRARLAKDRVQAHERKKTAKLEK